MELPFAESWKIKMVEPIRKSTRQEREQWIKEAHFLPIPVSSLQAMTVPSASMTPTVRSVVSLNCKTTF